MKVEQQSDSSSISSGSDDHDDDGGSGDDACSQRKHKCRQTVNGRPPENLKYEKEDKGYDTEHRQRFSDAEKATAEPPREVDRLWKRRKKETQDQAKRLPHEECCAKVEKRRRKG